MVGGLARGGLARLLLVPSGPSAPAPRPASSLVLASKLNQVTTITMNNPGKYNAWDMALCNQLVERFEEAAQDDDTKVEEKEEGEEKKKEEERAAVNHFIGGDLYWGRQVPLCWWQPG